MFYFRPDLLEQFTKTAKAGQAVDAFDLGNVSDFERFIVLAHMPVIIIVSRIVVPVKYLVK